MVSDFDRDHAPGHGPAPVPGDRFLAVLTTTDSEAAAQSLARGAVEARLAACAQISSPIASVYRWEGRVETAREWQVLLKTTAARYEALAAHIRTAHGYDTPEIIATPITHGDEEYLAWVAAEVEPSGEPGA
ncbi:divalent-cation tolerance protein CutA [Streptomyces sp. NPDC050617]|uniref:divalent-cation tolerance protein CutA n=1 Tax=Streptomyces sp. NPDC050617 TaxID=3154628 RepID=UPI003436C6B0